MNQQEAPTLHETAPNRPSVPFHPIWWAIATFFGCGHSPVVSGTVGGFGGMLLYLALGYAGLSLFHAGPLLIVGLAFIAALFFIGVLAGNWAEAYFGTKDDGRVVVDEVVGFFICVIALPFSIQTALIAFFVSRIVDIIKPPPANDWQRFRSGWGIMIDDVVASIYGLAFMHLVYHFIWTWA